MNDKTINQILTEHLEELAKLDNFTKPLEAAIEQTLLTLDALQGLETAIESGNIRVIIELTKDLRNGEYHLDSLIEKITGTVEVEQGFYELIPILERIR